MSSDLRASGWGNHDGLHLTVGSGVCDPGRERTSCRVSDSSSYKELAGGWAGATILIALFKDIDGSL